MAEKKVKKEPSLTLKQEKFCRNIVEGMSKSDAYRKSYNTENMLDTTINREAYTVFLNPNITTRIAELNRDKQELLNYDLKAHIKEIDEVIKSASEVTKLRGVELKGKAVGLYVEKKEVNNHVSGGFNLFASRLKSKEEMLGGTKARNITEDGEKPS